MFQVLRRKNKLSSMTEEGYLREDDVISSKIKVSFLIAASTSVSDPSSSMGSKIVPGHYFKQKVSSFKKERYVVMKATDG